MKKHPSSTAKGAAAMFDTVQQPPIMPPAHCNVPDEALPFWRSIIDCRPRETWHDHDLEIASELAKDQLMAQQLRREVEANGTTSKGKPIAEFKVLNTTISRIALLTRLLQLNTSATNSGQPEDRARRNAAEKEATKQVKTMEKYDGLIALRH